MSLHPFGQQPLDGSPARCEGAAIGFQPLDRQEETSLKAGALAFLDAIDRASLAGLDGQHQCIRVPIDDHGVTAVQVVCSCGWLSLPFYGSQDVTLTGCPVGEAERERRVRARSVHAVSARGVLLRLIASIRG